MATSTREQAHAMMLPKETGRRSSAARKGSDDFDLAHATPAIALLGDFAPLDGDALAAAPPAVQKQMIGEKFYPAIARYRPELAGKITGIMLEMDNCELVNFLESDQQLKAKIDETIAGMGLGTLR